MSNCKSVCKLCPNFVISTAVAFDPTTNSLDITIPENSYRNCQKVCIVVAQTIPTSATINALVNIVVGGTRFPLQRCNCTQISVCEIGTRKKYSTRVITNTVSGVFRLLGRTYPCCPDNLETLPFTPVDDGGAVAPANADIQVASVMSTTRARNVASKGVSTNE